MPGKKRPLGNAHPNTIVMNQIKEIFLGMGFFVAEGPEVEYDHYNLSLIHISYSAA